jgi:hypothetical protein
MNVGTKSQSEAHEPRDVGALPLIAGVSLGVFWSAGVTAFLIGYHDAALAEMPPQDVAGIAFIALAPAVVFAFAGWAVREMIGFGRTARLLDFSARRLAAPVANAKADARTVADAIAEQIERLNKDSEGALARLAAMEEVLRHHAESVQAASLEARNQVDALIEDLRRERSALGDLSDHLRTEASKISETIDRQTEIVSTATRVAANQADEGRSMLDRSAGAMTDAAGAAQRAGEKAALAIDEQLRDMQALVNALEERGGRLEEVARIHSENVKIVQQTAHDLNLAADAGADSMKLASEAALEQARRVTEVIEKETSRAIQRGMEEIERMRRAAQAARETADSAGLALEASADAVLERVRTAGAAIADVDAGARTSGPPPRSRVEPPLPSSRARIPAAPAPLPGRARSEPPAPERRASYEDDDWADDRPPPRSRRGPDPMHANSPEALPPPLPARDGGRRSSRYAAPPPSRRFDEAIREDAAPPPTNGRRPGRGRPVDDLDDDYPADNGHAAAPAKSRGGDDEDAGEWRWRDLLKNIDESPTAMLAGEAVVTGLRRAGVDPSRALDPDMTARVARARRRAGTGEARALVVDGALNEVRRTSAALAADPTLRGRAEEFVGEHGRLIRRAIDENDARLLSSLLDSDMGRAYLLLDAALADA